MGTLLDESGFVILGEDLEAISDELGPSGTPSSPATFGTIVPNTSGRLLRVRLSGAIPRVRKFSGTVLNA